MPTVLRQKGFEVRIYTNDHAPAHVHVWRAGEFVIINLGDDQTKPHVRKNINMRLRDIAVVLVIIGENQSYLLAKWGEYHA